MRCGLIALLLTAIASVSATAVQAGEKVTYAVTTTNISVGHAAQSSIPIGLGLWKDAGLDVEVIGLSGATAGVQQVASGQVDFATVGTDALMIARSKGIKVKAFYTYAQRPIYQVVALKGNGITKIDDLKGKTIGVPDMSAGSVPFIRSILKRSNIDPDKDVKWLSVGLGAPAANALRQKAVDVWAAWDTAVAALESNGFEFMQIAPQWANEMPGNVLIAKEETITANPERAIKIARGIAESTIFGFANPAGSVRNHWKLYPSTKPQGGDDEKALKNAEHIFNARFDLMKLPPGVTKWGMNIDSKWRDLADMTIEQELLPKDFDVKSAYTNEFIDKINEFDADKIKELARKSTW
jgi:NitT/TauT family transport system substrate-binding protein